MPVTCDQQRAKWRIVNTAGQVERTPSGAYLDGGGHDDRETCMAQARAINEKDTPEATRENLSKDLFRKFKEK